MLDHLGIRVSDYAESKRFYESALAPLGYGVVMEFGGSVAGLGAAGKPDFWISPGEVSQPIHIAFASPDRATVDAASPKRCSQGRIETRPPGRSVRRSQRA
jgi:catechol 2,3-dioxygenase-like lactoylglutathione lyase family enzyme